jgi:L-arabinose isomerase
MIGLSQFEMWFVTGSQHLYGDETLRQVAANAEKIAAFLDQDDRIPVKVVFKPVVTGSQGISSVCLQANNSPKCIGLICWMHTFSPAKMWISGLTSLLKPFLHLHTQFNREIPFKQIDMNFMNLNQSAHGDREFGFIGTRLQLERKVVVGHWQEPSVAAEIGAWSRAASALLDSRSCRIARFGDNMRDVAVTEGNKVSAQVTFGYEVHGFGVGDLAASVGQVEETAIDRQVTVYMDTYKVEKDLRETKSFARLREAARLELGLRNFLENHDCTAFTTTFEDLHGLNQLPGLACQRLMADGYGFGAEGDWKTAALVRAMKVMGTGLSGGTSFMEDYTYHMPESGPALVLGAHMLEVCPSISAGQPALEIHPLSIGGKADPARLVFSARSGPALNATLLDMGNRFRLLINEVEVVDIDEHMPNLPVASVFWEPQPDLKTSAASWIYAGGAHHTSFSQAVTTEQLRDFAEMTGIECLVIDRHTDVAAFRRELRHNHLYYGLALRS